MYIALGTFCATRQPMINLPIFRRNRVAQRARGAASLVVENICRWHFEICAICSCSLSLFAVCNLITTEDQFGNNHESTNAKASRFHLISSARSLKFKKRVTRGSRKTGRRGASAKCEGTFQVKSKKVRTQSGRYPWDDSEMGHGGSLQPATAAARCRICWCSLWPGTGPARCSWQLPSGEWPG